MRRKRNLLMLLLFALTIILSACGDKKAAILSMDEVRDLAQQGEALSWKDFEGYPFEEVGSGLYIRKYEINDDYHVLVGGGSVDVAPLYINLVKRNGEKIDIRYDDIDHFILN